MQCTEVFELVQELMFHLQNLHCVELEKELKWFSSESEVDTKSRKVRRSENINVINIDMKYHFVNEAAKLQS